MRSKDGRQKIYISIGEAVRETGLNEQTIRKMADEASLLCYRTPSGQRRIHFQSIQDLINNRVLNELQEPKTQKNNFIYARVSTKKQMDDLSRQIEYLKRPEYSGYTIISDIGSGINFKRKGLSTILDSCLQRNIGEVVIAHRDRLCRFGYELIDQLVTRAGGKIKVIDDADNKTDSEELADDLLAIIHIFSCRQMGKRSYVSKQLQKSKDKDLSNEKPKDTN